MFAEASPSSLGKSRCAGSLKWNIISARASPRGWGIDLGSPGLCTPSPLPHLARKRQKERCQTKRNWRGQKFSRDYRVGHDIDPWYIAMPYFLISSVTASSISGISVTLRWKSRLESCSKNILLNINRTNKTVLTKLHIFNRIETI